MLYDSRIVEVYYDNNRIALHIRKPHCKAYTTIADHMPPHHQHMQQVKGWNKEDLLAQVAHIGESTVQAATLMLQNSIYTSRIIKLDMVC